MYSTFDKMLSSQYQFILTSSSMIQSVSYITGPLLQFVTMHRFRFQTVFWWQLMLDCGFVCYIHVFHFNRKSYRKKQMRHLKLLSWFLLLHTINRIRMWLNSIGVQSDRLMQVTVSEEHAFTRSPNTTANRIQAPKWLLSPTTRTGE